MALRHFGLIALLLLSIPAATRTAPINDNLSVTFSERFRFVSWDNTVSLSTPNHAERTFTRHRTTVGLTWRPRPRLEFGLALTNEFRYYLVPQSIETDLNEVFVDQLYATFDKPYDYPLKVTVGRQNIILGEGFVVMDGGPLDGSRSIYFNAVRADWTFAPSRVLTLFAVTQRPTDKLLPILHEQEQAMVEQPEQAVGVYYSGLYDRTILESYYIYKRADSNTALPRSNIHTIGVRGVLPLRSSFDMTVECARQLGDRGTQNRTALGGYAYLTWRPEVAKRCRVIPVAGTIGALYLSGGPDGARTWKNWDPVFSRWPKWSDSYIYTMVAETRVAYWTNLTSLFARAKWKLDKNLDLQLDYHRLGAPERPDRGKAFPGGSGNTRGDLLIGKLSFEINPRLTGHVVGERFWPGDYYFGEADSYLWMRTELLYKW